VVVASLKGESGCTEHDIRQHFRLHAPPYMTPKVIEFRDELPKTATGKIDRPALKAQYLSQQRAK
jgi:long-chain acyl-CoA synthetase